MSDSPFSAVSGVEMTPHASEPSEAPKESPAGKPDGAPARAQQPPRRARAGEFTPWRQESRSQVAEVPEDPGDPLSGLVARSIEGNAGKQIARRAPEPTTIQDEVAEAHAVSERDAGGAPDENVIEVDATLLWDDPRVRNDPRFQQLTFDQLMAGVEAAEKLDALTKLDDLPDELSTKFRRFKDKDGRVHRMTVAELERGWYREAEFHRRLKILLDREQSVDQRERGIANAITAFTCGDGKTFIDMIQYIGGWQTFEAAATIWGLTIDAERNMRPSERQMLQALRESEARSYAASVRERALINSINMQQAQIQQQHSPDSELYNHQLSQMVPLAMERMEKDGYPYIHSPLSEKFWGPTWEVFKRTFDGELTVDKVVTVMRSVMQSVEDELNSGRVHHEHVPQAQGQVPTVTRTAPQPAGGRKIGNQAGAPNYANGRGAPKRIGDIANIHKRV